MSPRLGYVAKVAFAYGLYYSGLMFVWQRLVLRRRAVVLMYHRVLSSDDRRRTASHNAICVSAETFARHMAVLSRHFVPLSAEQFHDHLARHVPFPNRSVLITFDDGWRDNYTHALPILRRHGLPALVFLPASYVGSGRLFWQEALVHLLTHAGAVARRGASERQRLMTLLQPFGLEGTLSVTGPAARAAIVEAVGGLKAIARDRTEDLIAQLCSTLGVNPSALTDTDAFIDDAQLDEMAGAGITFGGHGVDHLLLTQVPEPSAEQEIRGSKAYVDERLRPKVSCFSYPNGYLNEFVVSAVRRAGFQLAVTTRRGLVRCTDDPLVVGRVNIHEAVTDREPLFLARVTGLL